MDSPKAVNSSCRTAGAAVGHRLIISAFVLALLVAAAAHAVVPAGRCPYRREVSVDEARKMCVYICPGYGIDWTIKRQQICPISFAEHWFDSDTEE